MDSLAIEFAPGALNAVKVQVIRGCKTVPPGHAEVGGLLCGAIVEFPTSTVVRIDSVIPVTLEPRAGRPSHLSNTDKWYLSKAAQDFASRPIIGWYRSQMQANDAMPESSAVILDEDRASSAELFPKGKTAFLICYPDSDFNLPGRLCIWSAGKAEVVTGVSLGQCMPVVNEVRRPRAPRFRPWLKATAEGVAGAMAETLRAATASLWPRSARVLAFAFPPMLVLAAFMLYGRFRPGVRDSLPPRPASLGMKASRVGNEIFLNWNRSAPEVLQAEKANLTILDDGRVQKLKLSAKDLQTGSLTCPADGDDVRIDLDVVGRLGDFVESLRVVGETQPMIAETAPAAVPLPAEIKQSEPLPADKIAIPDKVALQQPIAPPRLPEGRNTSPTAPVPKVAGVFPQVKAKPPEQLTASTVKPPDHTPDKGSARAVVPAPQVPIPAPQVRDTRRVIADVPRSKPAAIPEPVKTQARPPVTAKVVTSTQGAATAATSIVQPARKNAPKSVISVLPKASPSRSAIVPPAANPRDVPRMPVPEQRRQAKTSPRVVEAEEYVKPSPIQTVQPSFDDSARTAIGRALAQNTEAHEVRVKVNIDEHGSVVQASVASTTGPFAYLLVDSALDAARRWQFKPATADGRPVASSTTLRFAFVRKPH